MSRLSSPAVVAISAALGGLVTLGIGVLVLGREEAGHLVVPILIAIALTVVATAIAVPWLARASLRVRFASVAALASAIGLANLVLLSREMVVDEHDALLIAVLVAYAAAAAIGVGLAAARSSSAALGLIASRAQALAAGDLGQRLGSVGGGPELEQLASTLDATAARLEESLRRERAVEAQRRDLIVAVSHDLRTPLAELRAMAEAIEDGVVEDDPATIRLYSARMSTAVTSLGELVDDLFEFVQLDAGAIEAETERARLDEVVRSAIAACDGRATDKGLLLRTDLGPAASAACSPRLTRVVQNLLQNAIRHTPVDGTVLVAARQDANGIELAVSDDGEGIDPAVADRIFEPFWRGDVARASDGSGLGLAVAKRIVEALGGSIAVESEPRQGSRFAVLLPP